LKPFLPFWVHVYCFLSEKMRRGIENWEMRVN
jgi:hypothetical protein